MKKFLIIILISTLIGGVFAFILFKKSNENIESALKVSQTYTAFQLGVYQNHENALNKKKDYNDSIIVKDDDYYRVYFSILKNKSSILKMEEYLKDNNINYYKKQIIIDNNDFIDISKNYEKVLIETTDEKVFLSTNKRILKEYK